MHRNLNHSLLALLVGLGACSDGGGGGDGTTNDTADAASDTVDISGDYDSVTREDGPCGDLAPDDFPPPFIRVDSLQTTYYVRSCQSLDDTDCPSIYYDFNVPIENGWSAEGGSAFFSGTCTLSWERSEATLVDGTLTVRTLNFRSTDGTDQDDCTLEAAEALTECTSESLLTAEAI